jgi:basic amino acid/polyamine antiporter, APA family
MDSAAQIKPLHAESIPKPTLGAREAFAITIGIVIGAGIFRTPSLVAGAAASETIMLLAWVVGGGLSIVGALCYAELATTYPQAGGDYAYLRRAYGPRPAFLYAWARLTVIQTGSIVLLAYVVGDYMRQILDLGPWSSTIYAAITVVLLTACNWLGIRQGTTVQNVLTVLELLGLGLVIVAGLLFAPDAVPLASAVDSDGGALGLVLVFTVALYLAYIEAMRLKLRHEGPGLRLWEWPWAVVVYGVGIPANVAYNAVVLSIVFLERPREWLSTHRFDRWAKDGHGWRQRLALWVCHRRLNPYHDGHCG